MVFSEGSVSRVRLAKCCKVDATDYSAPVHSVTDKLNCRIGRAPRPGFRARRHISRECKPFHVPRANIRLIRG